MKTLIQTMTALTAANLVATISVFAGNVDSKKTSDVTIAQYKLAEATQQQAVLATQNKQLSDLLLQTRFLSSRSGGLGTVLVIPSAEITTEEIAKITEDMNIMSRIFEKNLQQSQININSMFISSSDLFHVALTRSQQSTQGMYLQGYGVLYLMKVDFPLSPGPKSKKDEEIQQKDEEDVDPVWTQMKQDMFEPEKSRKEKSQRPEKEYDAEKVENLKTTLVQSLKHAANIRSLKPDESVVLTITGSSIPSGYKSVSMISGRNEAVVVDHNNKTQIIKGDLTGDIGRSLPTVLVIRAKKSDIDSFAKGDLDFDQFQQKTQILTSAYLADQTGADNLFTGTYFSESNP